MFATISYENNGNKIIGYKIENASFFDVKYLNIKCYKKQALRKIEKKIYKRIKYVAVSKDLNNIKFKKIKVINVCEKINDTTKSVFEDVINLIKFKSVSIIDNELNNKEYLNKMIKKCELINVITDNIEEFYNFSEEIYSEYGVLLQLNNKNFNEQIGLSLDDNYIWFLKSQRKYFVRQGSVGLNYEMSKIMPNGIDLNDFAFALSQEKGFNSFELENERVLERNGIFYEINNENIKKFLDN